MWQPDCCHTSYMKNACPRETAAVRTCGPWGWRMAGTLKKRHGDGRFGTLVWMVFRFACLLRWLRSIRRAQPCDSVGSPDSCPLTSGYYLIGVMTILVSLMAQQVIESACKAGNLSSIPKLGRSPGREQPTAILARKTTGTKGTLWGTVHGGLKESDTTEMTERACMTIFTYLYTSPVPSAPTHYTSNSGLALNRININKSQENVALTSASCHRMLFSLL